MAVKTKDTVQGKGGDSRHLYSDGKLTVIYMQQIN